MESDPWVKPITVEEVVTAQKGRVFVKRKPKRWETLGINTTTNDTVFLLRKSPLDGTLQRVLREELHPKYFTRDRFRERQEIQVVFGCTIPCVGNTADPTWLMTCLLPFGLVARVPSAKVKGVLRFGSLESCHDGHPGTLAENRPG